MMYTFITYLYGISYTNIWVKNLSSSR